MIQEWNERFSENIRRYGGYSIGKLFALLNDPEIISLAGGMPSPDITHITPSQYEAQRLAGMERLTPSQWAARKAAIEATRPEAPLPVPAPDVLPSLRVGQPPITPIPLGPMLPPKAAPTTVAQAERPVVSQQAPRARVPKAKMAPAEFEADQQMARELTARSAEAPAC